MKLTDPEWLELRRRADAAGVTVPRFLLESALVGDRRTVSERHAVIAQLMAAKASAAGAANNLNQLARVANTTGRVPVEVVEAAAAMLVRADALEAEVARLRGMTG